MPKIVSAVLGSLLLALALFGSVSADSTVIQWDGSCYSSEVNATGLVTITKTYNGWYYDVLMTGNLSVNSPGYLVNRQELPPGFLPDTDDQTQYACDIAHNVRDWPVNMAMDTQYVNGALYFPWVPHNGNYELLCKWRTTQRNPSISEWNSCAGISVLNYVPFRLYVPVMSN